MDGISLTDRAARRIKDIMATEPPGSMLRISVSGGGCSGFQYSFDIDRSRQDEDVLVERNGASVIVDPISLEYMGGSVIDFVDDLISIIRISHGCARRPDRCAVFCAGVFAGRQAQSEVDD